MADTTNGDAINRAPTADELRALFLLDPEIVFLNHGSFGACPRPVFEIYQDWQRQLERQPVEFLGRRHDHLLDEARARLGLYLNADPADLIFVPNATVGINAVARSLALAAGDEILTTDHEYGAMDYTWQHICHKAGAYYVRCPIPLPVTDAEEVVERLWSAVTPRTRAIFLSHITSPTALILPVEALCRRARDAGVLTIIDGAHAPGQIPLDLTTLDADFYTGNAHKWLCAPKGAAFLYARREQQDWLEPPVISWGWPETAFARRGGWQGTRDIAAYLSIPAAIDFQAAHDWPAVRGRCHTLAREARRRLADLTGLPPVSPDAPGWFAQMVSIPLPTAEAETLKMRLYDEYRIEAPLIVWNGGLYIRVSFQGYNDERDLERLLVALSALLGES
ncbi:MAG: aminotransferase class V-fold PLP-dependent enzyme [Chloroflexi bacterium]|nr:aminotransferase class V-fold PLP-dependent enzyme [Chloroflexota bacterium]